jgi:hypothetical protein
MLLVTSAQMHLIGSVKSPFRSQSRFGTVKNEMPCYRQLSWKLAVIRRKLLIVNTSASPCSRATALLICNVLIAVSAAAVCPVPTIEASGEFFKRNLVFTGKVTSQRYVEGKSEDGWYYRVRVTNVFKGANQKELTVYTGDDSVRFPLEVGREYLLFADERHGRLEIDSCGNSALLSEASKSLEQIKRIATANDGEIEGWVVEETGGINLSGIHVVIRGGSRLYRAVTDSEGWFHFRAPKGIYRVDFRNHEYYLNRGDLFWYEPDHFVLHDGETASLQMVSVRHKEKPSR